MNPELEKEPKKQENTITKNETKLVEKKERKEITITSDDVDVNYS